MKKTCLVACLFLLLLTGLTHADESISVNILDMHPTGLQKVDMVVSVLNNRGEPVKGLGVGNFKVMVEGKEIPNFSLKPIDSAKSPLSVILAMDVSGSMKGAPIAEAQKAASIFLDQLDKEDSAALLTFGSSVNLLADFTPKKHEVREKIQGLKADEQLTWLYQGTYASLDKAAKAPTSRAAVVLLTDGKDEGSPRSEEDVLGRIKGTLIPIYALGFGPQSQVDYLKKVAATSGGSFFYTPTPEELSQMYGMVLEQIKNQYLIEFPLDKPAGTYTAILKLDYRGTEYSAQRRFLQVSAEPPQPAPPLPPVQSEPKVEKPPPLPPHWSEDVRLWGGLLVVLLVVGGILVLVYVRRRSEALPAASQTSGPEPVTVMVQGKMHPITPPAMPTGGNRATVILQSPGEVGLRIDMPPIPLHFPLIDKKNNREYQEIIITRYDDGSKPHFIGDRIYLLLADDTVSRPDEQRAGHARIFMDPQTLRYQIEDLGSTSGTKINDHPLTGKDYLGDRDIVAFGGVTINFYDKRPSTETRF
jgi:VWFA-related protein